MMRVIGKTGFWADNNFGAIQSHLSHPQGGARVFVGHSNQINKRDEVGVIQI